MRKSKSCDFLNTVGFIFSPMLFGCLKCVALKISQLGKYSEKSRKIPVQTKFWLKNLKKFSPPSCLTVWKYLKTLSLPAVRMGLNQTYFWKMQLRFAAAKSITSNVGTATHLLISDPPPKVWWSEKKEKTSPKTGKHKCTRNRKGSRVIIKA